MSISACHGDRIRVEGEPRPVAWLDGGPVVSDVNGTIVVYHRLQPLPAGQRRRSAHAEIAAVGCTRRPGQQIAGFEAVGPD